MSVSFLLQLVFKFVRAVIGNGITGNFSATTRSLMGGAIQGASLKIANEVTTLAGSSYDVDGAVFFARFYMPMGITSDGTNLYIADTGNNKIRKIVLRTGVVTTLAGSGEMGDLDGLGIAASFNKPSGIFSDSTNLYIADSGNNKIRMVTIATGVVTTVAGSGASGSTNGAGMAASFKNPLGITGDGTSLFIADTYNNEIRKIAIATGIVTTLAGSGTRGNLDASGTAASFNNPNGITSDGTHLYIADSGNNKIRMVAIATGVVTTVAGSGAKGDVDGAGTEANFDNPVGVISDGANLYIVDGGNNRIRMLALGSGVVTTLVGSSGGDVDGVGTATRLAAPSAITSDGTDLYTVESENQKVRKIVIETRTVTTIAGVGFGADGTGKSASFFEPYGITTNGAYLYVADTSIEKIRKIDISTGVVTTLAGGEPGDADGIGSAARFISPIGITSDDKNLYIVDSGNQKIRKLVVATGAVSTLAGNGGSGDTDGIGTSVSFNEPSGITNDGTNLYITDRANNKIRKLELATGIVTTLAGAGTTGSLDGRGVEARFNNPEDITTDGANLYVCDSGNNKIRKIEIATGVVTTLAGSGAEGSADGIGAMANFYNPQGITSDGTNLYVTEGFGNKVRKIVIATQVVTTIAGSGLKGRADGIGKAASFSFPSAITTDGSALFLSDSYNHTIRKIH